MTVTHLQSAHSAAERHMISENTERDDFFFFFVQKKDEVSVLPGAPKVVNDESFLRRMHHT